MHLHGKDIEKGDHASLEAKKNKFNNNPTEENNTLYKKQRNFCVNLLRKEMKKYYSNLNVKIFEDNKAFWKVIKPSSLFIQSLV